MAKRLAEAVGKPTAKTDKNTTNSILKKRPDYNEFEANNWIKEEAKGNEVIKLINKAGGAVWLNAKGDLVYRVAPEAAPVADNARKAEIVLGNLIGKSLKILRRTEPDITETDLILTVDETFEPLQNSEFYKDGRSWYRNTFMPTHYMALTDKPKQEPATILRLMRHLVSDNEEYYRYFLNWLAYMWQTMTKPVTAIVLQGVQGSGKGVFFNDVIEPLFGHKHTIEMSGKMLTTNYIAPYIKNKLFILIDEAEVDYKERRKAKNVIKPLITNDEMTADEKFKTQEKNIKIKAAVMIASNEYVPVEIEHSDRRFNVFGSNIKLTQTAFLGLGTYQALKTQLYKELEDFARYLYHYDVDANLANTAMMTPEKQAIIEATNDKFTLFANALVNRDLEFFAKVEEKSPNRYLDLKADFAKGRIKQPDLHLYFSYVFDEEIKTYRLTKELKLRYPQIFGTPKRNGRERFFILPDKKKK